MMTYQASREDAPGLKEAGETSLAAGTSAVEVTHTHRALVLSIAALFAIGLSIAAVARTSGAVRGFTAVFGFLAKRFSDGSSHDDPGVTHNRRLTALTDRSPGCWRWSPAAARA